MFPNTPCPTCPTNTSSTFYYTGDNTTIFANPERGLQKYSKNLNSDGTYRFIDQSEITGWRTGVDKVTVIYRYTMLTEFITNGSSISNTYLSNLQTDFDRIRNAGLKVILRPAYTVEYVSVVQPNKQTILDHINQLSAIINLNRDIIISVQSGFIGVYGEWYYTGGSSEFGDEGSINPTQWLNRKNVVDSMLSAFNPSIPLQVRSANAKRQMYGSTTLTNATAYQNTATARVGFYNDAFLNNYGDMGTYDVSTQCTNPVGTADYNFIANSSQYLPMNGETNGFNSCDSGLRTNGSNAVIELNALNFSTLNRDYFTEIWDQWTSQGYYNEIVRNLGYRLQLNFITVIVGTTIDVTMNILNVGYGNILTLKKVYLIFKNASGVEYKKQLNVDTRFWTSNQTISQSLVNDIPDGQYNLLLQIADINLESRPEYCIRLANSNITYNNTTGYNNLLTQITMSNLPTSEIPSTCLDFTTTLPLPDLSDVACGITYDSACVNYTGPNIACAGILTDTPVETVLQLLSTRACNCCENVPVKVFQPARLAIIKSSAVYGYSTPSPNVCALDDYVLVYVYRPLGLFTNTISVGDLIYMGDKTTPCVYTGKYIGIQLLSNLTNLYVTFILSTGSVNYIQQCLTTTTATYIGTMHNPDISFPTGGSVTYKDQLNVTQTLDNIFDDGCELITYTSLINTQDVVGCTPLNKNSYLIEAGSNASFTIEYIDRNGVTKTETKTNASLVYNKVYTFINRSIITAPSTNISGPVRTMNTHVVTPYPCRQYVLTAGGTGKPYEYEYINCAGTLITGSATLGTPVFTEGFDTSTTPSGGNFFGPWTNNSGVWQVFNNLLNINAVQNWQPTSGPGNFYQGSRSAYIPKVNAAGGSLLENYLVTPAVVIPSNGQLRFYTRMLVANPAVGANPTYLKIKVISATLVQNSTFSYQNVTPSVTWSDTVASDNTYLMYDPILNPTGVYNQWTEKIVDLSAYSGQNVYIAFIRENLYPVGQTGSLYGGNGLYIDSVNINSGPTPSVTLNSNDYFMYSQTQTTPGPTPITDTALTDNGYYP
jgi:hypothetical protein